MSIIVIIYHFSNFSDMVITFSMMNVVNFTVSLAFQLGSSAAITT